MPTFFERLQKATRIIDTGAAPAYLRTHPMTFDRMADMQGRAEQMKYRQVPDTLEFQLVRAKLRVLTESPRDSVQFFEESLKERKFLNEISARYGLTSALLAGKQVTRATTELGQLLRISPPHPMIANLAARIALASGNGAVAFAMYRDAWSRFPASGPQTSEFTMVPGNGAGALAIYRDALARFPTSRPLTYAYLDALLQLGNGAEALQVADARLRGGDDARLYLAKSKAYALLNRRALSHQALAESYFRQGNTRGAVEQMMIAQKSGDASFQEMSIIEARLREMRRVDEEAKKDR
jgi:predicted Zn-dependent protease